MRDKCSFSDDVCFRCKKPGHKSEACTVPRSRDHPSSKLGTEVMACTEVKGTKAIRLLDSTGEEPQRVPDPGVPKTDLTTVLRVETATLGQGASVREPGT